MAQYDAVASRRLPAPPAIRWLAGPVAFAVMATLTPPDAAAQSAASRPVPHIETAIAIGTHVSVETRSGKTYEGHVTTVSPARLELLGGTRRDTIPVADIWRVRARYQDRVGDGAKRGALIGLVGGFVFGTIAVLSDCGGEIRQPAPVFFANSSFCSGGFVVGVGALFGGIGSGIGAGIGVAADSMMSASREVWRAPDAATLSVSPMAAPGSAGLNVLVKW